MTQQRTCTCGCGANVYGRFELAPSCRVRVAREQAQAREETRVRLARVPQWAAPDEEDDALEGKGPGPGDPSPETIARMCREIRAHHRRGPSGGKYEAFEPAKRAKRSPRRGRSVL